MHITFYGIEVQADREQNKEHARKFAEMKAKSSEPTYQRLSEVVDNPDVDFEVGDMVVVTNGYGVKFLHKILGFCKPTTYGGCVYWDWDCYWYPKNPKDIVKFDENYKLYD